MGISLVVIDLIGSWDRGCDKLGTKVVIWGVGHLNALSEYFLIFFFRIDFLKSNFFIVRLYL